MSRLFNVKVTDAGAIAQDIVRIRAVSEYIASSAVPGQFINVNIPGQGEFMLRRPFSISGVDGRDNTFEFAFKVRGKGTRILSAVKPGDMLDIMGPLGNGFTVGDELKKVAVIGGGLGIFPLLFLLDRIGTNSCRCCRKVFAGYRNKQSMFCRDELTAKCEELMITTEDGSYATAGLVTCSLEQSLTSEKYDMIFTCGPAPMLKEICRIAANKGIGCQVCMEERMGCGIGACLVCACKTNDTELGWRYSHVCKDGPVFNSTDLIFD